MNINFLNQYVKIRIYFLLFTIFFLFRLKMKVRTAVVENTTEQVYRQWNFVQMSVKDYITGVSLFRFHKLFAFHLIFELLLMHAIFQLMNFIRFLNCLVSKIVYDCFFLCMLWIRTSSCNFSIDEFGTYRELYFRRVRPLQHFFAFTAW